MGSVMAPAAYDTLKIHLEDFNIDTTYYDLILTGDLSTIGSEIFKSLLRNDGIEINNHNDCGLLLYDINNQSVNSGGSGAACSALVTFSYILNKLKKKELKKVLLIATGALHSSTSSQQKHSIPAIAHAIALEV
jgi:stage V sporulation protein AD